jgi:hypothetical protein
MTDPPKGKGDAKDAAPEQQHQDDPALSRDATHSTYADNTDPALADLNPPTGGHVEQELGYPAEVVPPVKKKD